MVLCITDTGTGMNKEVVDQAFDPFFTTKDVGHGTGLGLSQVYGFVKQSGGHLNIYSEVGQGTTLKIYLPRLLVDDAPVAVAADLGPVPGGDGARGVSVVEDAEGVREHSVDILHAERKSTR